MPCQCFWASCHQTQIAKAGGIDNLVVTVMGYMISSCLSFPHASNFNEMIDLYLMFRIGVFLLAAYICFVVSLSFVVCCLFMGWLNCPFCVLAAVLTDLWLYFSLECYSHLGIMRFWWVSKKKSKMMLLRQKVPCFDHQPSVFFISTMKCCNVSAVSLESKHTLESH